MEPEKSDLIKNAVEKLPPRIRESIEFLDVPKKIQEISQKNNLRVDQGGILEQEVLLVIVGAIHPDKLLENLMREGKFSREIAAQLVTDAETLIFREIRKDLVEMHEKELETEKIFSILPATSSDDVAPTATQNPVPSASPTPSAPTNLPIAPSDAPLNTVQAQMSGAFRMAPDSVTLKGATPTPKPTPIAPVREGKYTSADPYREPTN